MVWKVKSIIHRTTPAREREQMPPFRPPASTPQLRVDKVGDGVRPVLGISEQRAQQAGAEGDPDDKAERVGLWHRWRS